MDLDEDATAVSGLAGIGESEGCRGRSISKFEDVVEDPCCRSCVAIWRRVCVGREQLCWASVGMGIPNDFRESEVKVCVWGRGKDGWKRW